MIEPAATLARPPAARLGDRMTVTLEAQFRDAKRRTTDEVSPIAGRWCARWVRRAFPAYRIEGWSTDVYPGKTYIGWWFGTVEIVVNRTIGDSGKG